MSRPKIVQNLDEMRDEHHYLEVQLSVSNNKTRKLSRKVKESFEENEKKEAKLERLKTEQSRLKRENQRLLRELRQLQELQEQREAENEIAEEQLPEMPPEVIPLEEVEVAQELPLIGMHQGPVSRYTGRVTRSLSLHERDFRDCLPLKYLIDPSEKASTSQFQNESEEGSSCQEEKCLEEDTEEEEEVREDVLGEEEEEVAEQVAEEVAEEEEEKEIVYLSDFTSGEYDDSD